MEYDGLHRPLKTYVRQGSSGSWICFAKTLYGETLPQAKEQNLLGQAYQSYDQSGVVTIVDVDFKGNVLRQDRQMTVSYEGKVYQILGWTDLKANLKDFHSPLDYY